MRKRHNDGHKLGLGHLVGPHARGCVGWAAQYKQKYVAGGGSIDFHVAARVTTWVCKRVKFEIIRSVNNLKMTRHLRLSTSLKTAMSETTIRTASCLLKWSQFNVWRSETGKKTQIDSRGHECTLTMITTPTRRADWPVQEWAHWRSCKLDLLQTQFVTPVHRPFGLKGLRPVLRVEVG